MDEISTIIETLKRIEARLNDMKKKVHVVCYLCKQYTNSYTTVEYGSKYDGAAVCHECLDKVIGQQMQYMCANCHKPTNDEQVITHSGVMCMNCFKGEKE